jgi:hypothetical protein
MTELNDHTNDTPPNWDRYAEMLRRQPDPAMPGDHATKMIPRIDAAIAQRARRARIVRWAAAPTLSAVMLVAILLFQMGSHRDEKPDNRPANTATVQRSKQRPKPSRPAARRRPTPPPVEVAQAPAAIDTAPVQRIEPVVPREEPIGPGPGLAHSSGAQATPRP